MLRVDLEPLGGIKAWTQVIHGKLQTSLPVHVLGSLYSTRCCGKEIRISIKAIVPETA